MSDMLYNDAQDAQRKLFYSLASVALGALALSIQFSPGMGDKLWWVLLLAWGLLLVSCVSAGWRLGIETTILRNMYHVYTSEPKDADEAKKLMMEVDGRFRCLTKIQIWTLVFGLLANIVFAGTNYINKIHNGGCS